MTKNRRRIKRPYAQIGSYKTKKVFFVATEGAKTEREYLKALNKMLLDQQYCTRIEYVHTSNKSSPLYVLKGLKRYLAEKKPVPPYEAWLVVDTDQWLDGQLAQLHAWAQQSSNHGLAVSNPNFEFWLLLHFEEGSRIKSSRDCTNRLKQHLPDYNKSVDISKFSYDQISKAIDRASRRDNPPCADWPRMPGCTTVYKLVVNIIQNETQES